jgi:diguanylate cyclase (GGDEF)-like protein
VKDILERCIALDTAAQETYAQLAARCPDAELKRTFERMGAEEWSHIEWWRELRDAYARGRVPDVPDEAALRETIEDAARSIGPLLELDFDTLDTDGMLELAIRMEFFMLDPAFGELIDLLDPGSAGHHREAYSRHVLRLVHEIETRYSHAGLAPFLARVLARTYRDQERLTTLATRDPLTGLYNRRGFYNYLAQWCSWSERYNHSLGVLLVDVDYFKAVNDTYGHPAGDVALCAVADALKHAVRDSDLVGRYGGDEFAVLAPEASADALRILADRVLESVRAAELDDKLAGTKLTVSIGCAYLSQGGATTPEALLSCADRSLYEAKAAGRDRSGAPTDVSADRSCEE